MQIYSLYLNQTSTTRGTSTAYLIKLHSRSVFPYGPDLKQSLLPSTAVNFNLKCLHALIQIVINQVSKPCHHIKTNLELPKILL